MAILISPKIYDYYIKVVFHYYHRYVFPNFFPNFNFVDVGFDTDIESEVTRTNPGLP